MKNTIKMDNRSGLDTVEEEIIAKWKIQKLSKMKYKEKKKKK